jgi:probable 2-oxoglutarate dehydrogenase E1 component DHKTD1
VALFSKIKGNPEFDPQTAPGATGDVISHLSGTRDIDYDGKKIKVQVLQNPSHLEVGLSLHLGIRLMSGGKSRSYGCNSG